jgi:hypothetical protein
LCGLSSRTASALIVRTERISSAPAKLLTSAHCRRRRPGRLGQVPRRRVLKNEPLTTWPACVPDLLESINSVSVVPLGDPLVMTCFSIASPPLEKTLLFWYRVFRLYSRGIHQPGRCLSVTGIISRNDFTFTSWKRTPTMAGLKLIL